MREQNDKRMNWIDARMQEIDEAALLHISPIERAKGYVHSCFAKTINFKINGKLLALHSNEPVGPMTCLVGENDFNELRQQCRPGMKITGRDFSGYSCLAVLDIQGRTVIRLGLDDFLISPPCRIPPFPGSRDAAAGVSRVIEHYLELTGDRSIFDLLSQSEPGGTLGQFLRRRARKIAQGALSALRASSLEQLKPYLYAAVALGPGLTPAGDDFCYGLLASELSLSLIGRGRFPSLQIQDLTRRIAAYARAESTEFSASLLELLADGYIFPMVKDALESAVAGEEKIRKAVAALAGCGHSSGSDMLDGIHLSLTVSGESSSAACPG